MAYEIFDDLAFYYMATTIIALITIPFTLYRISTIVSYRAKRQRSNDATLLASGTTNVVGKVKREAIVGEGFEEQSSLLNVSNIVLLVLWTILILLLVQLSGYDQSALQSYDPYSILGITKDVGDREIKRAYRALSLLYHPDKNPSADAAAKFEQISKAYAVLTDDAARENFEKYGNPDGYKGMSFGIGLPAFLTTKSNETRILFAYFFLFIVLPPAIVLVWWRRAKAYSESGVLRRTMEAYFHLLTPTVAPKFLIEVLSFSAEYEPLQHPSKYPTNSEDFNALYNKIKDSMVRQKFFDPTGQKYNGKLSYVGKASVLLHAFLQRMQIPASLQPDLLLILRQAHKLLNAMLEVAIRKGMLQPIRAIVSLMQFITQAMWPDFGPLVQLPHIDPRFAALMAHNKLPLVQQIRAPENRSKREAILKHITPEQWKEIDEVAAQFPLLEIEHSVTVEDEQQPDKVYAGDLVLLKVELYRNRQKDVAAIKDDTKSETAVVQNGNDSKATPAKDTTATATTTDSTANDSKKAVNGKPKHDKALDDIMDDIENSKSTTSDEKTKLLDTATTNGAVTTTDEDDDLIEDVDDLDDDELLDRLPQPPKKDNFEGIEAPLVHSLHFPFEKREKWVLLLLEKSAKGIRLAGVGKVPPLVQHQTVEMRFMTPPEPGTMEFDVVALCDSYVGCDTVQNFKVTLHDPAKRPLPPQADPAKLSALEQARGWFDDEDDPNYQGKWYYFGVATLQELLINIFVLSLLGVFIFNFLVSRGWWSRYIQPGVDLTTSFLQPVLKPLQPYISPIITPISAAVASAAVWVSNKLTVEPKKVAEEPTSPFDDLDSTHDL